MRFFSSFVFALVVFASGLAAAQTVDPDAALAQCAKFFAQGDLETAVNSCDLALAANPRFASALRLKTRVLLAQQKTFEARDALDQAVALEPDALENTVLDAELAAAKKQTGKAAQLTDELLSRSLPQQFEVRVLGLSASAAIANRQFDVAVKRLQRWLSLQPSNVDVRRRLSNALLNTDPKKALQVLRQAPDSSALLQSELGRVRWITGDLQGAVQTLEKAVRNPKAFANLPNDYGRALGALAFSYYGLGQFDEGARVMALIPGQPNVLSLAIRKVLPWLLGLLLLLGVHLVAESRIEPLSVIEYQDGPRPWTVGNSYAILLGSVAVAFVFMVAYSRLGLGNWLAVLTPVQSAGARDVFLGVLGLALAAATVWQLRRLGWNWREQLPMRFDGSSILDGALFGLVLAALVVGFQWATQRFGFAQGFYLDFVQPRNTLVLPLVTLPLTEIFFRAFNFPAFDKRYGDVGQIMLVLQFALVFATPLVLLILLGYGLYRLYDRNHNIAPLMVAWWVGYAALLVLSVFVPLVRGVFY